MCLEVGCLEYYSWFISYDKLKSYIYDIKKLLKYILIIINKIFLENVRKMKEVKLRLEF